MNNILKREVSFYPRISGKPETKELLELLTTDRFKDKVEFVREQKRVCKDAYRQAKLNLPAFTVSGVFADGRAQSLMKHSGLIAVDIDKEANADVGDFAELKERIKNVPYVAYCGRSVGGEGFFCIIPIKAPERHKEHFASLKTAFARCGISIDGSCGDVSRKRFVSFDDKPYINPSAETYTRVIMPTDRGGRGMRHDDEDTEALRKEVEAVAEEAERLGTDLFERQKDDPNTYDNWFKIGCSLASALGEGGRELFHRLSAVGSSYNFGQCDRKFDDCLKTRHEVGIGTFFKLCKERGLGAAVDFKDIPNI